MVDGMEGFESKNTTRRRCSPSASMEGCPSRRCYMQRGRAGLTWPRGHSVDCLVANSRPSCLPNIGAVHSNKKGQSEERRRDLAASCTSCSGGHSLVQLLLTIDRENTRSFPVPSTRRARCGALGCLRPWNSRYRNTIRGTGVAGRSSPKTKLAGAPSISQAPAPLTSVFFASAPSGRGKELGTRANSSLSSHFSLQVCRICFFIGHSLDSIVSGKSTAIIVSFLITKRPSNISRPARRQAPPSIDVAPVTPSVGLVGGWQQGSSVDRPS